jgi:hypothetical protein
MTNSTGVECGGDSGADPRWIAAIGFSCVASCGAATGLVMQKLAHNNQQALPEEEKAWESNGFIASPLWVCGMVVLVFVPLPFDLVALTLGALSCVHERRHETPSNPTPLPLGLFTLPFRSSVPDNATSGSHRRHGPDPCTVDPRRDGHHVGLVCDGVDLSRMRWLCYIWLPL